MMKRYDNIQIFRVLACLGVFATHLAPKMGITGWAAALANQGASGVYLFFVISGFLACTAPELKPGSNWKSIRRYLTRRMLRILPLYDAVILYNMALHGLLLKDVPADPGGLYWLRYFFLTNAWIPAPDNFWGNLSATWTISLFFVFYLCAPLLVRLLRGTGRAMLGYALALALRYGWAAAGLSDYMMIFYYLHYFVLGMLVWELLQKKDQILRAAGKLMLLAAGILLCLQAAGIEPDSFMLWSWGMAMAVILTSGFRWQEHPAPPEAANTDAAASAKAHTGSKILRKIIGLLDQYSYAIYLVHAVVLDGIALLQAHVPLSGISVFVLAAGLTAVGAWAAHQLIEKPFFRLVTTKRM